ncbi:MAG: tetratricopeptide repeat protein [Terriglobia bacterium]
MGFRHKVSAAFGLAVVFSLIAFGQAPRSVYEEATALIRQNKLDQAEASLRSALKQYPGDPAVLGLLGVVLDSQKRYEDAEREYNRAIAVSPRSPFLQNNLGNHFMAQGKTDQARVAYLKVLAVEPKHPNANLQLARICVEKDQGTEALRYLANLGPGAQSDPVAAILHAQALKLANQPGPAEQLLQSIEQQAGSDPRVSFDVGMTYVKWQRYPDAEAAFTRALDSDPSNFDLLYNLGLAARKANHLDRALSVFQVALQQRPGDADCLFNLANVYSEKGRSDQAVILLLQAHNAAPQRPDILYALALVSQEMGFYADAATAIDKYLQLKPHDDIARRERGFCYVRGAKLDQGMEDLRWYVEKYPKDARGLYELAIGETVRDREKALAHLNEALELDSALNAARYARAIIYYQKGQFQESVEELKLVLKAEPKNFQAWDALGQNYLRLNQAQEAVEALARANEISPRDAKILTHYSRALLRVGRREEAEKVTETFKGLGPEEGRRRPYGGLFEFLQLPPEEQFAKYTLNLQRSINTRPDDPGLRVQLAKALLYEGKMQEAVEAFRAARRLTSDTTILASIGKTLLDWEQYDAAREFLETVALQNPAAVDARIDLSIAVFHSAGPEPGLKELDEIAPANRNGDYYLLRAQILDALGKPDQATDDLNHGFEADPHRPDLYFQAALFLVKHKRYRQAADMLTQALKVVPDSSELMLTRAIVLELLQQNDQSQAILNEIQTRWPEWALPYLINGITLEIRLRSAEARPMLENAVALGAHDAMAYYYLASAIIHAAPDDLDSAQNAIDQALKLDPKDAYIRSLAGKIAYAKKDYPAALQHLNAALERWPEMIEARQTLAGVYRAMGEREKSGAELKEILRIKQANPTADQAPPFPADDLLFSVRPLNRPSS